MGWSDNPQLEAEEPLPPDEAELLELYRIANDQGKALIAANARMIAGMPQYSYQYPGSPME